MELPNAYPPTTASSLSDCALSRNDFTSMPLVDINLNTFVRTHDSKLKEIGISKYTWLVIDQRGLETSTCLVCDQFYNPGEGWTSEFRACRLPWEEAWIMFANLDVANMRFEDYVDIHAGEQADGSWRWISCIPDTKEEFILSEAEVKREEALKALRDSGFVD
ncbi:hypothetical protein MVEN_01723900 [Mycena venus]|uniref:DUF6924 domain-containing protein n=1 Tax=Mycena venus TaxID=2733690 RepID=A0A8H7CM89_9AGAR|nr:hypothetical protein MVEN_01723900 [Mycena venus]